MSATPLHPAVVHVPLGLSIVIPLLALILTVRFWREGLSRFVWGLLVLLQALVLGAGLISLRTGETEEHRVKDVVTERALEAHEESGRLMVVGGGVALTVSLLVLVLPVRGSRWGMIAATAMTLAVAAAAFEAGHSGGELVYVHGAASAGGTAAAAAPGEAGSER